MRRGRLRNSPLPPELQHHACKLCGAELILGLPPEHAVAICEVCAVLALRWVRTAERDQLGRVWRWAEIAREKPAMLRTRDSIEALWRETRIGGKSSDEMAPEDEGATRRDLVSALLEMQFVEDGVLEAAEAAALDSRVAQRAAESIFRPRFLRDGWAEYLRAILFPA